VPTALQYSLVNHPHLCGIALDKLIITKIFYSLNQIFLMIYLRYLF